MVTVPSVGCRCKALCFCDVVRRQVHPESMIDPVLLVFSTLAWIALLIPNCLVNWCTVALSSVLAGFWWAVGGYLPYPILSTPFGPRSNWELFFPL